MVTQEVFTQKTGINVSYSDELIPLWEYLESRMTEMGDPNDSTKRSYDDLKLRHTLDIEAKVTGTAPDPQVRVFSVLSVENDIEFPIITNLPKAFRNRCFALSMFYATKDPYLLDMQVNSDRILSFAAALAIRGLLMMHYYKESHNGEEYVTVAGLQAWEDYLNSLLYAKSLGSPANITTIFGSMLKAVPNSSDIVAHTYTVIVFTLDNMAPSFVVYDSSYSEPLYYPDFATPEVGFMYSPYVMHCYEIFGLHKAECRTLSDAAWVKVLSE